jgi:ABC-type transport system involved in cytochrome bd biosynthesis fused ATPase/permease subunit
MNNGFNRIIIGVSIVLNVLAIGILADGYARRYEFKKYNRLVEAYEQIGETDADMLLNCADVVGSDFTKEEAEDQLKEAEALFEKMQEEQGVINKLRTELGLD